MAKQSTDSTSHAHAHDHAPSADAIRSILATDAQLLHRDLDVPIAEAARRVVRDSDYVPAEERKATLTALLARLDRDRHENG